MLKQIQKELYTIISTLQFTTIEVVGLIVFSTIAMFLSVLFLKPTVDNIIVSITDKKIATHGTVTKIIISEAIRPGVNRTNDKKSHVYPYDVLVMLNVDNMTVKAYPNDKDKKIEYLSEAIKFAETISKNSPMHIELRDASYIDTIRDCAALKLLEKKTGETNTMPFVYCKKHPDHNSLNKVRTEWAGIIVPFLLGVGPLIALFLAINYSTSQKILFLVITLLLAIYGQSQWKRADKWFSNYAEKQNPIALSIDVDQNYDPDEAFRKITKFVKSRPKDDE